MLCGVFTLFSNLAIIWAEGFLVVWSRNRASVLVPVGDRPFLKDQIIFPLVADSYPSHRVPADMELGFRFSMPICSVASLLYETVFWTEWFVCINPTNRTAFFVSVGDRPFSEYKIVFPFVAHSCTGDRVPSFTQLGICIWFTFFLHGLSLAESNKVLNYLLSIFSHPIIRSCFTDVLFSVLFSSVNYGVCNVRVSVFFKFKLNKIWAGHDSKILE